MPHTNSTPETATHDDPWSAGGRAFIDYLKGSATAPPAYVYLGEVGLIEDTL